MGVDVPVDRNFQSYQIPTTLRADVPVAIRTTKNLEDTMLPVNYQSWRRSFSKLPILSTMGVDIPVNRSFQGYQIPTTLRADVPVAIRATNNLEDILLPVNYQSWQCSFSELPILSAVGVDIPVDYSFQSYQMLSTVGVDISVNRSFHSYQNPDNFKSWHSCSFQSYLTAGRPYASRQLLESTP